MKYLKPLLKICSHFGLFFITFHLLISCQPKPRFQKIEMMDFGYIQWEGSLGKGGKPFGARSYATIDCDGSVKAFWGIMSESKTAYKFYQTKISEDLIEKFLARTDTMKELSIYRHLMIEPCKGRQMIFKIRYFGSSKTVFFYRDHADGLFLDSVATVIQHQFYLPAYLKNIDSAEVCKKARSLLQYIVCLDKIHHVYPKVDKPKTGPVL